MNTILIIGKVWPEAKSSAAGTRMMQLIAFFIRQNCQVNFVCAAKKSGFEEDLTALGVKTSFIELNNNSFNIKLNEIKPTHVLYDRFMTEEQFGWRVRKELPNAIQILNTEDLHFLREARKSCLKNNQQCNTSNIRNEILLRELAAILRCDKTLMVSEFEVELLTTHYGINTKQLIYYPVLIDNVLEDTFTFEERKDLLFIGNFYHQPNYDAVLYLKKEIWPKLKSALPRVNLNIYGAYTPQKVIDFNNPKERFLVHGRAKDALMLTKHAKISLAPLRYGAGIKGKILEAMACNTPFVTTGIGAEGMLNSSFSKQIANNTSSFISCVKDMYTNKNTWLNAQEKGFKLAQEKFNYKKYEEALSNTLLANKETNTKDLMLTLLNYHAEKHYTYLSKWIVEKNK